MLPASVKPVKLQPPGAGLPIHERLIAKCLARLVWPLTSPAAALRQFKCEADKILAAIENITNEQARKRILVKRFIGIEDSSRYWSIFMVLDHLCIVDGGIERIIETLALGDSYGRDVRIQDVKPRKDAGPEVVDAFINTIANYEKNLRRFGTLDHYNTHSHPWFGALNAHGWHCLASFHHGIHRRQIERIKKSLGE